MTVRVKLVFVALRFAQRRRYPARERFHG